MRRALATWVAVLTAGLGAVNVSTALRLEEWTALEAPDAWLPLTASLAGWLVTRLSPANAIGWLLLTTAAFSAVFGGAALVVLGGADVPALVAGTAAWLSAWAFLPAYLVTFLLIPLLYPTGGLPSPHWRPVLVASTAVVVAESVLLAFGSEDSIAEGVANPLALAPVGAALEVVEPAIWVSMPVLALLGVAALVQRVVVSRGPERRAPLVLGAAALAGVVAVLVTGSGLLLGLLLPLVVAGEMARLLHDRLEEQLEDAQARAEDLRASRARVTRAHDDARRRIERDLHDGAQQGLLALSMDLSRLSRRLPPTEAEEAARLQGVAQQTLDEVRRLATGTFPSALRDLGLAAALREAVGPSVSIDDRLERRPAPETEAALYFACLEAVTNAHKHAGPTTVTVRLEHTRRGAHRFVVADDGVGFDRARTTSGSGLVGMADRLGATGGTLTVDSAPGRGTRVTGLAYDVPEPDSVPEPR